MNLFLMSLFVSLALFAEEVVEKIETSVLIDQIVQFVKNCNGMSYPVMASGIIVIIITFFKSKACGAWFDKLAPIYKRLIIGCLGLASSALLQISSGMTISTALYGAFIISGGAVLIFEFVLSVLPAEANKWLVMGLNTAKFFLARFKKQEPPAP